MNEREIYENWKSTPKNFRGNMLDFQNWFDITDSLHSVVSQGHIDFHTKILTPSVYRQIGDVRKKSCLEIGFGGGRLINAAACVFDRVTGVDIHDCFDMTDSFLKSLGRENYTLVHQNDSSGILDSSQDFVFSFIVFQHFGSISVFYNYLDFAKRVLKPSGCCNIHFGKNKWNNQDYYLKSNLEPGTANSTLFYSEEFVKKTIEQMGFQILEIGQHTKLPWTTDMSGQFYITFKK